MDDELAERRWKLALASLAIPPVLILLIEIIGPGFDQGWGAFVNWIPSVLSFWGALFACVAALSVRGFRGIEDVGDVLCGFPAEPTRQRSAGRVLVRGAYGWIWGVAIANAVYIVWFWAILLDAKANLSRDFWGHHPASFVNGSALLPASLLGLFLLPLGEGLAGEERKGPRMAASVALALLGLEELVYLLGVHCPFLAYCKGQESELLLSLPSWEGTGLGLVLWSAGFVVLFTSIGYLSFHIARRSQVSGFAYGRTLTAASVLVSMLVAGQGREVHGDGPEAWIEQAQIIGGRMLVPPAVGFVLWLAGRLWSRRRKL